MHQVLRRIKFVVVDGTRLSVFNGCTTTGLITLITRNFTFVFNPYPANAENKVSS